MADLSRPLRWGLLGASRVGRFLAPAVLAQPGHRIIAVAARDGARANAYAQEIGAQSGVEGYATLIADPSIDVIYVGLTNDQHLVWALAALRAGKQVLCEKPLTLNAGQVEQLIAAERETGGRVMEAFCHTFHPRIERARDLIEQGTLGRLVGFHACFLKPCPPGDFRWTAGLGGGSLYDRGGYCVALARYLIGAEPSSAFAMTEKIGGLDASLTGLLDFGNGLTACLRSSMTAANYQDLTLSGTQETLYLDWPITNLQRETRLRVGETVEVFAPCNPYQFMVTHFVGALAGRWRLRHGMDEALAQARVLDALLQSAASQRLATITAGA